MLSRAKNASLWDQFKQESPVVADKPARRESMAKLLKFDVLQPVAEAEGAWPPRKSGRPPRNMWFERVQGGL